LTPASASLRNDSAPHPVRSPSQRERRAFGELDSRVVQLSMAIRRRLPRHEWTVHLCRHSYDLPSCGSELASFVDTDPGSVTCRRGLFWSQSWSQLVVVSLAPCFHGGVA
jgi:hypothetical protein